MKKGEKIIQILLTGSSETLLGLSNLGRLFKLLNKKGSQWILIQEKLCQKSTKAN
jgi:hypothetical protein